MSRTLVPPNTSPWPSGLDFGVLKGSQVFVTHKSSPDTFPNEDMHVGRGGIEPPSSDFQSAALTTSATVPICEGSGGVEPP